jgi:hypothetical protein
MHTHIQVKKLITVEEHYSLPCGACLGPEMDTHPYTI